MGEMFTVDSEFGGDSHSGQGNCLILHTLNLAEYIIKVYWFRTYSFATLNSLRRLMLPLFFILAWYTLPIFTYIGVRCCSEPAIRIRAILLTMVCGYVLIIATVLVGDATDRAKMETFDLNRDGRIEGFERTRESELAMRDQGRDTGRALAPILGIPLTAIWYTLLFGLLYGGDWTFRKLFVRTQFPPDPMVEAEQKSGQQRVEPKPVRRDDMASRG